MERLPTPSSVDVDSSGRALRPGLLGDVPTRSYARKLELFARFAEPELRALVRDLPVRAGDRLLDAGCGTGHVTTWLAERVGAEGSVVGIELSTGHVTQAAWHAGAAGVPAHFVQGELPDVPFPPSSFDGIWIANTVNHLHDPVNALAVLRRLLRVGGWIAVGQSHLLPEMIFVWDERLEGAVTQACRQYYRDRYGLDRDATSAVRRVYGTVRDAGFLDVTVRTVVIERTAPLSRLDEEYYRTVVFEGSWGERLAPFLSQEDRDALRRLCDPEEGEYALRRADFHAIQTFTLVCGTVLGAGAVSIEST